MEMQPITAVVECVSSVESEIHDLLVDNGV